jgi:hypothetical protein
LLPAGPTRRILVRHVVRPSSWSPDGPALEPARRSSRSISRIRVEAAALERARRPAPGSEPALIELGAARLGRDDADDLARLVPEYVTLPAGVTAETGEVSWSRTR